MQVHPTLLSCTAFIGAPADRNRFRAKGTGFFLNLHLDDHDFGYFVTAKHLLWPNYSHREAKRPQGSTYLRVTASSGDPVVHCTNLDHWEFHPDRFVDLCAYPVDPGVIEERAEINFLNLSPRPTISPLGNAAIAGGMMLDRNLTLGEEIFIVGTFVGRVGERRNIPVVRIANVAALPTEPVEWASPRHPAYLIETRSLGGTSGSPVFLNPAETRHATTFANVHGPYPQPDNAPFVQFLMEYKLIGMVLGAHAGDYSDDFISETDTDITPDKNAPREDADFNAGISVVLPVKQIYDFLNAAEMIKAREATLEQRRKESGYFPTSAGRRKKTIGAPAESAHPTTGIEGDEQHKERFTALLDAAVGKPKQGG